MRDKDAEIELIKKGNELAFRNLMNKYSNDLFVFARGIVKHREIAEEVVSDVFFKFWNKKSEIDAIYNLKSYLFISVKNECINYIRRKKNTQLVSIEDLKEFYTFPYVTENTNDIESSVLKCIYQAIEQLPPKCKMAFTLAKVNGLKYKEISRIMGISVKTINIHIANAIEAICTKCDILRKKSTRKNE